MTVSEAIAARRSIRKYDPRPIEPEKLRQVLEAGRLAPSGSNRQEWKFIVVTDPQLRQQLATACHNQQKMCIRDRYLDRGAVPAVHRRVSRSAV